MQSIAYEVVEMSSQEFDWKELVKTIAPAVGTALGSPLAGAAVSAVAETILDDKDASEDDISKALEKPSNKDLKKLKELDKPFKKQMKTLGVKPNSAVGLASAPIQTLWPQALVSLIFVVGFFGILFLYLTGNVTVPKESEATVNMLLGPVVSGVVGIVAFWIGSSFGSKKKDEANLGKE